MRSLRRGLILGTTAGTGAVLVTAGVLVYLLARRGMVEQFDRALTDKAGLLASAVEQESKKIDLEFDELDLGEFQRPAGPGYLQLWLADGGVLYRSPSLGERDLDRSSEAADHPACRWMALPGGRWGRAVQMGFTPRSERRAAGEAAVVLVLARDAAALETTLASLRAALIAAGVAAVALSAGVLWVVVRRGLRPLDHVAEHINRLGGHNLCERIDPARVPREVRPVVERLNELLDRLDGALQRERCFSADVAHELRTPLAGLRTTMDVALSRNRQAAEYAEAIGECHRIVLNMQAMVENLLAMARLEAGRTEVHPRPVRPAELTAELWRPLADRARARGLHVQCPADRGPAVVTDRALLSLVLRNLLENALTHADEGGAVTIDVGRNGEAVQFRIANTGSTVPAEEVEKVFDRFWRSDASRSAAGVHCGLGLPLVKRAVSALGGSVKAASTAGGSFEVTVAIPDLTGASGA